MKRLAEKFSFKNSVKLIICIVGISACIGCSNSIEIEQEVTRAKLLDSTFYVETQVWVRNWKGFAITLEYNNLQKVKGKEIYKIKKEQLIQAEQIKKQLLPLVKH